MKSVYCAVRTVSLNKAICSSYLKFIYILLICTCSQIKGVGLDQNYRFLPYQYYQLVFLYFLCFSVLLHDVITRFIILILDLLFKEHIYVIVLYFSQNIRVKFPLYFIRVSRLSVLGRNVRYCGLIAFPLLP